jgi:hypothetical protein
MTVTNNTTQAILAETRRLRAGLTRRVDPDTPVMEIHTNPDLMKAMDADFDDETRAGFELAFFAGFDEEALEAAKGAIWQPRDDEDELPDSDRPDWHLLMSAISYARRKHTPDLDRARRLASDIAIRIPGDRRAYRPEHVRMALALLDEERARAEVDDELRSYIDAFGWTLDDARWWLIDFENIACGAV